MWYCMFVFVFFCKQMTWQIYVRDSRECFAKVRHQYILSAASAFTFWNNWAFRMQSGAWQAQWWAPEKAIANENAPQHNSFHESLPSPHVKRDVLKHLFFESPQPPLGPQHLPSMTQAFGLVCTAGPTEGSVCAHFPPVTACIWRLTPSCELQYFPHTSADTEGL